MQTCVWPRREVPLFLEVTEFPFNTVKDGWKEAHMPKTSSIRPSVSCFSKIQIGFTFLVPAHLGSSGNRAVKRVCVYVCLFALHDKMQLSITADDCSPP